MRRENSGRGKKWGIENLTPKGKIRKENRSQHSQAWRRGYTDFKLGGNGICLYLDSQMLADYEAGYKQAEKDKKYKKEWLY